MTDLPAPSAPRLARARWLDTRLLVGLLLVLVSVVVGAKVVSNADDTVPVWKVTRDIGPGVTLASHDLVRTTVHLPDGAQRYLAADGHGPVGYVLIRPVGKDELLPRGAVSTAHDSALRRLSISVDPVAADGLAAGSVVDVYVVPKAVAGQPVAPTSALVVAEVTVASVDHAPSGLGASGNGGGVTLLVTADQARQVLDARSRGEVALLQREMSSSRLTASAPGPGQ